MPVDEFAVGRIANRGDFVLYQCLVGTRHWLGDFNDFYLVRFNGGNGFHFQIMGACLLSGATEFDRDTISQL
jgi:hypothetical protein